MDAKGPYIHHILSALPSRPHLQQLHEIFQQDEVGSTRFCLADLTRPSSRIVGETTDVDEARKLITEQRDAPNEAPAHSQPRFRICVIENISPAFIELIGSIWDLDVEFFVDHAMGCRGNFARVPPNLASVSNAVSYFSLDGVLAYNVRQLEAVLGERVVNPLPQYLFRGRGHYFRREHRLRTDGKAFQLNTRTSYYAKRLGEDSWIGKFYFPCPRSLPTSRSRRSD